MENREKRNARKVIWLTNKIVEIIFIVIVLILIAFAIYSAWDTDNVTSEASPKKYEIYKPYPEQMSFEKLRKINCDVFGWITIYGTNIDYPLLQSDDNDKYISTNPLGESAVSGSIFLDYRNSKNFSDFNSIIYGHHMINDVMFGDIEDFSTKKFFKTHKYGNIYYNGKNHGLQFFAFMEEDAYAYFIYTPGWEKEMKAKYLSKIKENAKYYRDIGIKTSDHIVLLSTCASNETNGRYILVAKITKRIFNDPFNETKTIGKSSNLSIKVCIALFILLLILLQIVMRQRHLRIKNRK